MEGVLLIKYKDRNTIIEIVMLIGLAFFYCNTLNYSFSSKANFVNSLLLLLLGIISILMCTKKIPYSYSVNSFIWLFVLFFCSIAPLMQLNSGSFPWQYRVSPGSLFTSIFYLYIWIAIYCLFYYAKPGKRLYTGFSVSVIRRNSYLADIILVILAGCAVLMCISYFGYVNLFSRKISAANFTYDNGKMIPLIMGNVIRNLPICVCSMEILRHRRLNIFVFISLIFTIITKCPTGIGRFDMAVAYIGLVIIAFPRTFKNQKYFELLMTVGILYIFPVINIFRYVSIDNITIEKLMEGYKGISKIFSSGDFDAFSIYVMTVENIDKFGPKWGAILGSIFFFVPRSIWKGKPEGSGTYIAEMQGLGFDNISCPVFAEGYLNGGFFGFILMAALFATIVKKLDTAYWNSHVGDSDDTQFLSLVYPYLLGYIFTICRGALISCFAYTIGFVLTAFLVFCIANNVSIKRE